MLIDRSRLVGFSLVLVLAACTGPEKPTEPRSMVIDPARSGPSATGSDPIAAADRSPPGAGTGSDLYLVDPSTGTTEPILVRHGPQEDPEPSPVGRRIVYQSWTPGGEPQIFVLGGHGNVRQLTRMPGGAADPTWSPDGSQIAFAAAMGPTFTRDIFLMDADGSHVRRLTGTAGQDDQPDWSPDGIHITFQARSTKALAYGLPRAQVWVATVRDGELTLLIDDGSYWAGGDPAWSPDGRWIAYTALPGSSINNRMPYAPLWIIRSDGTGRRTVHPWKKHWGLCEFGASWSPDGRSIAFIDRGGGSSQIGILDVQTQKYAYLDVPGSDVSGWVFGLSWGRDGLVASVQKRGVRTPRPIDNGCYA